MGRLLSFIVLKLFLSGRAFHDRVLLFAGDRPVIDGYGFSCRSTDAANVQFALGVWNLYIRFSKRLREAHRHIAFEPEPIFLISPETKLKVERTIAKTYEIGLQFSISCHSRMCRCHF